MTIADLREKCKVTLKKVPRDLLIIGILIAATLASFGLGYLAGQDAGQGSTVVTTSPVDSAARVLASKSGTKYYFPNCPGADRISDDNKVWFTSTTLAEQEGYSPADNCEGLK